MRKEVGIKMKQKVAWGKLYLGLVFIVLYAPILYLMLIGGNRVITLGTAIEEHFLTTQNWGMGSTIGVVLILAMFIVMFVTGDTREKGGRH